MPPARWVSIPPPASSSRAASRPRRARCCTAGCTFSDVVRAGIYLLDFANFPRLNELYGEAMGDHRPARTTIQVAALPKGGQVEIDVVARVP
jgi:enamine deaminase RidA (YjgF/YER057c/UK114 family)